MDKQKIAAEIIAIERAALEAWNQGNPSGYLSIYAPQITYFDPFQEKRLNGYGQMETLYEGLRGQISVDKYDMIEPHVEVSDTMAVLTYNLKSYSGEELWEWNCTEVYALNVDNQWKIVHNHWSLVKPQG